MLPGLTPEQATLAAQLATVAVQAALWPAAIPSPTPEPIYAVLLSASVRFGQAILQGTTLPVVSESLGSYSYRLAAPATLGAGFGLTEAELETLDPWIARDSAYDLSTAGPPVVWPADWWQRDYDTMEGPPTAEDPAAGGYLTEADGDARYSQLGHTHAHVFNAEWSLSTNTTAGDPGAGKVRESTLDLQAAGDLYLSTLDAADTDWSLYLQALAAGDTVVLQDRDDSTRKAAYQLAAAAVDEGGWYRLPVTPTPTPSTLAPTNNQALLVSFASPGHP